jgi:hypothetical protein
VLVFVSGFLACYVLLVQAQPAMQPNISVEPDLSNMQIAARLNFKVPARLIVISGAHPGYADLVMSLTVQQKDAQSELSKAVSCKAVASHTGAYILVLDYQNNEIKADGIVNIAYSSEKNLGYDLKSLTIHYFDMTGLKHNVTLDSQNVTVEGEDTLIIR